MIDAVFTRYTKFAGFCDPGLDQRLPHPFCVQCMRAAHCRQRGTFGQHQRRLASPTVVPALRPWWPESARSSSPIFSPAATTAAACSRPGDRVSRSIGPETETAASTCRPRARTGAETEATPGSRSAALAAQPRRRTPASVVAVNLRAAQPPVHPLALLPGEQHLGGRARGHRQRRADRHGVAQPAGPLGGGHADRGRPPAARGRAGRSPRSRPAAGSAPAGRRRAAGPRRPPRRARRPGGRGRTGPARPGRAAGGARGRPRYGARWGAPARSRRPAGRGWPGRSRPRPARRRPCRARRRR